MGIATASRESAILSRIIAPERPELSSEVARAILSLRFQHDDLDRMNQLAEGARQGSLTDEKQAEVDSYERIGHFLSLLKSKARLSLKQDLASTADANG